MKNLKEQLEGEIMVNFKPSPGLLNMIKCKEQAVKLEKYHEAQSLLVQIDQIKRDEEQRFFASKANTIDQHLANYSMTYDKKLQNMKKRQKTGLDELNMKRTEEHEILLKKYENLRRELENNYQIKVNIHEGKHTTSAGRHNQSPTKLTLSSFSPTRQKSFNPKQ